MEKFSSTHSKFDKSVVEIDRYIRLKKNIRVNFEKLEEIVELTLRLFEKGYMVILVLPNEREVLEMYLNFHEYSNRIFSLPAHDVLPFELMDSSINERAKRIFALFNLCVKKTGIYVTSLEGALHRTAPPGIFSKMNIPVKIGTRITEDFFKRLGAFGYKRVETVGEIGEFARRGFIIDVFSPFHKNPVRLELLDDEIVDIRFFDVNKQRSISKVSECLILPIHEYILSEETMKIFNDEIKDLMSRFPNFREFIEKLSLNPFALDELSGIFYRSSACLVEYIEQMEKLVLMIKNPSKSLKNFYERQEALMDLYGAPFYSYMYHRFSKADPERLLRTKVSKILLTRSNEEAILEYSEEFNISPFEKRPHIKLKKLSAFLEVPTKPLEDWEELKEGDYVVHKDYGIGKFLGIRKITNSLGTREYFELLYDKGVKLYVPVERMHRLHRYIGNIEGIKLGNLKNTKYWQRTKQKAREEIEKKVEELLKIYALRHEIVKKPSLGDQELESKFFDSFPHIETEDQLKVTEEILSDMADIKPMDRLLCGDSGAGKTEVAMRAAFRAVVSGKQVAFLVPTTVLAKQHYSNFKSRMERFGVKIEFLDRFKTQKETKKILDNLKKGIIDIIIGTHRLLSDDVEFKNLGLIIIDEEQRFGVVQKEKLKEKKLSVDVLSLSATPIPRTLYMSLSGIRDISLIENPPPGRVPVEVFVSKYDVRIVKTAILREISRGGQIFYIHNRINDLGEIYLKLREMLPDLKIGVAHGRMNKRQFDSVISKFYDGELDLLLSTTIVENGVDIPNANTLIVDDAHRYGLAQLYQIRGRVGRSNRRAFAYFLYPSKERLTNEAIEKLKALKRFGEPGGGFKLSLKDMEIRGVGNVLGFEQHGHINSIGFYMYREILKDVLRKYREEKNLSQEERNTIDVELEGFKMDILIPQEYITDSLERMKIYRRIAETSDWDDIEDIEKELKDRFGPLPKAVVNLLIYARIRILASKYGISKITLKNENTLNLNLSNRTSAEKLYGILNIGTVVDSKLIVHNFHSESPEKKLLELLKKGGPF